MPGKGGGTTVTKKRVEGSISGLNIYKARQEDPEYAKIRNREVEKRFRYSRLDIKSEDNPDGLLEKKGRTTTGSVRLVNTQTGEEYDFPESRNIPGYSGVKRNRDQRIVKGKSDMIYKSNIIEGKIDPVDSAKSSNYNVESRVVEYEQEVKPPGASATNTQNTAQADASEVDFDDNIDGVHNAEVDNQVKDASSVDGSGAGHTVNMVPDQIKGNAQVTQTDVRDDPTRAPVQVLTEKDANGEPIKGTSGIKYLTEEEAQKLYDEGRIKRDELRKHKKKLKIREKANEKGNIPYDYDKFMLNQDGDLVDKNFLTKNADGTFVDSRNGSAFTGLDNTDEPDISETVTESIRGPRVMTGIAGVPSEHKIKLYTKDPSWLEGTLQSLTKTGNGIVFPYTPTININHSANYGTYDINQSVEQPHFYSMTPNVSLQLTAVFTANTGKEAEYMLACMHFLRTATKADFGAYNNGVRRTDAGTPPPVLVFSGYGVEMFNNIPVIVRSVNFTLPEDVDYVSVMTQNAGTLIEGKVVDKGKLDALGNDISGEIQDQQNAGMDYIEDHEEIPPVTVPDEASTVPTSLLFSIDLAPQHPPSQLRDEWNFKKYASGDLLRKGYI